MKRGSVTLKLTESRRSAPIMNPEEIIEERRRSGEIAPRAYKKRRR